VIDGIINIYKEQGFTSHDVVAKLRGILGQKKIGHTGTLDPLATGVLPVCLGRGTKLCGMITDKDKIYRGVIHLGVTTSTQDITGEILKEEKVDVKEETVKRAVLSFVGEYEQLPPMYSAIKVGGRKLYEIAREGREIERQKRKVAVYSIEIEKMDLPYLTIKVHCSKGTYIRTLCHDIGSLLGCGACMESLVRLAAGRFRIEESLTLDEVERLRDQGILEDYILPVDSVFLEYPGVFADEKLSRRLRNGNMFYEDDLCEEERKKIKNRKTGSKEVRVYDAENNFIGIYSYQEKEHVLRPVKMFFGGN
jgi:tRNA pseudouridine55 synthase